MKFIYSDFNKDTGISKVTINHMGKDFTGIAKIHPEDKQYISVYSGCTLAEIRATIKAYKYEKSILVGQTKEWTKFLNACTNCKKFNKYSKSSKVMFKQYNKQVKKISRINFIIDDLKSQEKELIEARTKYIEKQKKRAEEEKVL